MTTPINRRDLPFVVSIIASFLFGVAFSWQRWGNPLVDCGREMNQPLRLANGEMLYSQVRHIYGPLSPYFNALLYRLFGDSLNVLYASGMVTAILILALTYWLSRQLMNRPAATAATLSVMWLCAFKPAGNYILPYSYSALHGCALGLITLTLLIKAVGSQQAKVGSRQSAVGSAETEVGSRQEAVGSTEAEVGSRQEAVGSTNLETDVTDSSVTAELSSSHINTSVAPQLPTAYCLLPTAAPQLPTAYRLLPTVYYFLVAGVFAALTLLAKTEMGVAAMATGLISAALIGQVKLRRVCALLALFMLPALILTLAVYGYILWRVGWHTFAYESYLLLQNVPPELVYFNKRMSGFDRPMESVMTILGALIRMILLAIAISSISQLIARRGDKRESLHQIALPESGSVKVAYLWILLLLSIALTIFLSFVGIMNWDNGPYLAMPILLFGLLIPEARNFVKQLSLEGVANRQSVLLLITSTYALASLARVILRVRSGGAYSSYLLPISVILFTYILSAQFTGFIKDGRARLLARNIFISLILADAIITSGLLAYRYRTRNTYPIVSERGTMIAVPDLGKAFEQAIAYINRETAPGDSVAVMPEGTSLLFFTKRKNPLREEITTPGFLDREGEERAIKQLTESNTRLILIANRATSEFGATIFGRDYCQHLMEWIKNNYEESAVFSPVGNQNLQIGDKVFFIKAYRKKAM